jgi:chromosome segregation ATPase
MERMSGHIDQKSRESAELSAKVRAVEFDISKSLARIDELNRLLEERQLALKQKEQALIDAETDLLKLKNQLVAYQKELEHLRALEERYRAENADVQRRIDQETLKNGELTRLI